MKFLIFLEIYKEVFPTQDHQERIQSYLYISFLNW